MVSKNNAQSVYWDDVQHRELTRKEVERYRSFVNLRLPSHIIRFPSKLERDVYLVLTNSVRTPCTVKCQYRVPIILKRSVILPHDYYKIIAAYALIPSALANVCPYLFLYGNSGSGKSTIGKLISYLHGVAINSSSDTFASIRNELQKKKYGLAEIFPEDKDVSSYYKEVEANTILVWDDVDESLFIGDPKLYRLIKFGYDRSTDKIIISSDERGKNLEFRCFCPKVFSSIYPLHLSESLKELKRRVVVIPTAKIEDLAANAARTQDAVASLNESDLIDISMYDWKGFSGLFKEFWDRDMAISYLTVRSELSKERMLLPAQYKRLCLDLIATGITCGLWESSQSAVHELRRYYDWFDKETTDYSGLRTYLKEYLKENERNCRAGNLPIECTSIELNRRIDTWLSQGWILEKPRPKEVKELMTELGYGLKQGKWIKR